MEIWGCSCYLTSVHFLLELLHPCTPCPAYGPPCYCMVVCSSALYCTMWYCTPCLAYGSSSKALYGIGWHCMAVAVCGIVTPCPAYGLPCPLNKPQNPTQMHPLYSLHLHISLFKVQITTRRANPLHLL